MSKLISELLDLPERVRRGDFVLNLSKGVTEPQDTLERYVVTPQLVECFNDSLNLIKTAVDAGNSKAAYLHGSFGSGKSHFMAVLHLLLQGNPEARSMPELAPVVANSNIWTEGRNFLMVPFHMIGSRNMEQGILGQYSNYVRKKHPNAPVPGVYLAESLFADAQSLREEMGDDTFFAKLNQGKSDGSSDGWGSVAAGWNAASCSPPRSPAPMEKSNLGMSILGFLIAFCLALSFTIFFGFFIFFFFSSGSGGLGGL